jgi:hypothetical protein
LSKSVLAIALAFVCAVSCAKKDPFDQAFIENDLQRKTAQEVHDAADNFSFDPPPDGRLTVKQIHDYIQVTKLADRIRAIADRNARALIDRPASAIGEVRSFATADLRACLNLGINPKENMWVGQQVGSSFEIIDRIDRMEKDIATAKSAMDHEIDPMLVARKRFVYERAKDNKQIWESSRPPAEIANAELVRKHRQELAH